MFTSTVLFASGLTLILFAACVESKKRIKLDGQAAAQDGSVKKDGPGANKDGPSSKKDAPSGAAAFGPFIQIPHGSFAMGAGPGEKCSTLAGKETRHQVTLTRGFDMQKTEVTQGQYKKLMGYNPSQFQKTDATDTSTYCGGSDCDQNPVERVSWNEAAYYCNKLSEELLGIKARCYDCTGNLPKVTCQVHWSYSSSGKTIYDCPAYRLPTEAEWEYAYRSKTTTSHYNGESSSSNCYGCSTAHDKAGAIGWYCQNSGYHTHPVGKRMPNGWGLLDMAGNVEEWTEDWYKEDLGSQQVQNPLITKQSTYRASRGGSHEGQTRYMRAAARGKHYPTNHPRTVGFRVVRTR
jgi:formylglycine-generating enzyme required for sulfatase activity